MRSEASCFVEQQEPRSQHQARRARSRLRWRSPAESLAGRVLAVGGGRVPGDRPPAPSRLRRGGSPVHVAPVVEILRRHREMRKRGRPFLEHVAYAPQMLRARLCGMPNRQHVRRARCFRGPSRSCLQIRFWRLDDLPGAGGAEQRGIARPCLELHRQFRSGRKPASRPPQRDGFPLKPHAGATRETSRDAISAQLDWLIRAPRRAGRPRRQPPARLV